MSPITSYVMRTPGVVSQVEAMRWAGDVVWVLTSVTGPAKALADLRALLAEPPRAPVLEAHVVEEGAGSIYYYTSWRRPVSPEEGVSVEHLALDVVGPDAVLECTIRDGRAHYRAVARDGARLLEFFNVVRGALGSRFEVRLHRVGEMRGKRAASAADQPSIGTEDQAILREALLRGYYDNPKKCGLRELGDALGFSKSAIARKLRTLERRALESVARSEVGSPPPHGR